ncbi:hypothetical protein MPSEU_000172700 [Mayamaea pseudoterrestris]|nr:hypothetical protein MPSEU_000172700 [Mayamaea pseudoterrestris]
MPEAAARQTTNRHAATEKQNSAFSHNEMIRSVYNYVEQRPKLLGLCFIAQLIGGQLFMRVIRSVPLSEECKEFGHECVPDMMFGLAFDLNYLYDIWSPEMFQAYAKCSLIDFFVIMPAYTLALGALLVRSAKSLGMSETLSHLATLAVTLDVMETYISRQGSLLYSKRLPTMAVRLASISGQCKWLTCYVSLILIAGAWFVSRRVGTKGKSA